jgi:polyphosphate kinase
MMHRNLDRRIEALVRLTEPEHLAEISSLFDRAMDDRTSSWHLDGEGVWTRRSVDERGSARRPADEAHAADRPAYRTGKRR